MHFNLCLGNFKGPLLTVEGSLSHVKGNIVLQCIPYSQAKDVPPAWKQWSDVFSSNNSMIKYQMSETDIRVKQPHTVLDQRSKIKGMHSVHESNINQQQKHRARR